MYRKIHNKTELPFSEYTVFVRNMFYLIRKVPLKGSAMGHGVQYSLTYKGNSGKNNGKRITHVSNYTMTVPADS